MKRTSKIFLLLATLGLLAGCTGNKTNPSGGGSGSNVPPPDEPYLLNVIYFKSYVSPTRANEIKEGLIQSLGDDVDASRINFFESNDKSVGAIVDQINFYNEDYPDNQISAVLGLNGISNAGVTAQETFTAKYETDEINYCYGTSSNVENQKNRKFWWDKEKVNDRYVKGLQDYLTANWLTTDDDPPLPDTNELNVAVFNHYVDSSVASAIETGFNAYLTTAGKLNKTVTFVGLGDSSTDVAGFADAVTSYNNEHEEHKIDALLGCRADVSNTTPLANAGYSSAGNTDYTYGNTSTARRFWYDTKSPNLSLVMDLKAYLDANYTAKATNVVLSQTTASVKVGEFIEVTASINVSDPDAVFTAVADKDYATVEVTGSTIKVTLSDSAVVDDQVVVTVSSGTLTPATLTITVLAADVVIEHHLVCAFYARFVTSTVMENIESGFATYLANNSITLDSVTFVSLGNSGTNVGPFADLITNYNGDESHAHPINVILGCKEDKNEALSNAGYKKLDNTMYTYGTDSERKFWVSKSYDATVDIEVNALQAYIAATYPVA